MKPQDKLYQIWADDYCLLLSLLELAPPPLFDGLVMRLEEPFCCWWNFRDYICCSLSPKLTHYLDILLSLGTHWPWIYNETWLSSSVPYARQEIQPNPLTPRPLLAIDFDFTAGWITLGGWVRMERKIGVYQTSSVNSSFLRMVATSSKLPSKIVPVPYNWRVSWLRQKSESFKVIQHCRPKNWWANSISWKYLQQSEPGDQAVKHNYHSFSALASQHGLRDTKYKMVHIKSTVVTLNWVQLDPTRKNISVLSITFFLEAYTNCICKLLKIMSLLL